MLWAFWGSVKWSTVLEKGKMSVSSTRQTGSPLMAPVCDRWVMTMRYGPAMRWTMPKMPQMTVEVASSGSLVDPRESETWKEEESRFYERVKLLR